MARSVNKTKTPSESGQAASRSRPVSSDSPAEPRKRRSATPEARRAAILDAALEEFTARGYEGARLDDVAKRAGVAKGTIYLYFADKEALFQDLVRSMVHPVLGTLEQMRGVDIPARMLVEGMLGTFVREILGTRAQGHRAADPHRRAALSGHRRVLLSRGDRARAGDHAPILRRAAERGELPDDALARFPQLIVAPGAGRHHVERAVRQIRAARRAG